MATIADVARKAGVSMSTVSHVVNNTRFVSPVTRAQVLSSIDELGFFPNAVARSLAKASTNTIGVAISTSTNSYFMDIVCAIERACVDLGQMVFLADTMDDPETELRAVRALHQRRVDGIIFAPSADPERAAIKYLKENSVPCVLVDRLLDNSFDQVGVTNKASMKELITHLFSVGHRRIAYVAGQPDFGTTLERLNGYNEAMAECGLTIDPQLVCSGNSTVDAAAQATHGLLKLEERPTVIATGNNLATIGVMRALREAKLRVPEEMAIAGFDDFEWAEYFEPRLTVVAQPCEDIGRQAAKMLSNRIKQHDFPQETVRLSPKLVIRDSCGHSSTNLKFLMGKT